jgi:drug/metabolite transporter (DMT)-like permease
MNGVKKPPQSALPHVSEQRALDPRLTVGGMVLLLACCVIWGGNTVAIKIGNRGFDPIFAATLRSAGAAVVLTLYALVTRQKLRLQARTMLYAFLISLFFSLEFLFLFWGTKYTLASRATIFVYTSPFWVALGAHFMLREKLSGARLAGLALAFTGVVAVFAAGTGGAGKGHLLGDFMELLAAAFWAANTLFSKRYMNRMQMTPFQLLFYQVVFSAPLLFLGSLAFEGLPHVTWRLDATLSLVHQTVVVVAITYLVWFWLLQRHQAGHLTAFTFFTPLFGVVIAGLILGDPLTWLLWIGVVTVAAGIYLVNRT